MALLNDLDDAAKRAQEERKKQQQIEQAKKEGEERAKQRAPRNIINASNKACCNFTQSRAPTERKKAQRHHTPGFLLAAQQPVSYVGRSARAFH